MTASGETVFIESWPFQHGTGSFDRNEILQECAVQLAADAKDYAGDNQEHPNISALANERNDGEGFDSPLGYPNDGPNSRLKADDLQEVIRRATEIYWNDHQAMNYQRPQE